MICSAYNRKHRFVFLLLALAFLEFDKVYGHLRGEDRLQFLDIAQSYYLQVILHPVPNPPPGRHNCVRLAQAGLRPMNLLPETIRCRVVPRVAARFPAFAVAFTVLPPQNH